MLKKSIELTPADLAEHSAWVSYYEPEEIELLDQLGLDSAKLLEELKVVGYSDEYVFPIPQEGVALPFKYVQLSAQVTTCSGVELMGYRTSQALSLLHKGRWYHFNKVLLSLSVEQASELCAALGVREIFPLTIQLAALSKSETYSLSAKGEQFAAADGYAAR